MICWYCENRARAVCVDCGKAVCKQHAHTFGFSDKIRCSECFHKNKKALEQMEK